MLLKDRLLSIFKSKCINQDQNKIKEIIEISEKNVANKIFLVEELTNFGVNNYCISLINKSYIKLYNDLAHLKTKQLCLYLKNILLFDPFTEDDLEKAIKICKNNLPKSSIKEYSIYME